MIDFVLASAAVKQAADAESLLIKLHNSRKRNGKEIDYRSDDGWLADLMLDFNKFSNEFDWSIWFRLRMIRA